MYTSPFSLFLVLVASSFVSSNPILHRDITAVQSHPIRQTQHDILLQATTSPGLSPQQTYALWPVSIPLLSPCPQSLRNASDCAVSSIHVLNGTAVGVDESKVECRAYKDVEGVVPGSAVFKVGKPALISTNLATVGSVLCYTVA